MKKSESYNRKNRKCVETQNQISHATLMSLGQNLRVADSSSLQIKQMSSRRVHHELIIILCPQQISIGTDKKHILLVNINHILSILDSKATQTFTLCCLLLNSHTIRFPALKITRLIIRVSTIILGQ